MRIQQIDISEIEFKETEYSDSLLASIKRIGLSLPIKVKLENNRYYCVDGHKRLSAISQINDHELYQKRRKINIVIVKRFLYFMKDLLKKS